MSLKREITSNCRLFFSTSTALTSYSKTLSRNSASHSFDSTHGVRHDSGCSPDDNFRHNLIGNDLNYRW